MSSEIVEVEDYIIVTSEKYRSQQIRPAGFEYEIIEAVNRLEATPLKVLALSDPFILCESVVERNVRVPSGVFGMSTSSSSHKASPVVTIDTRYQDFTIVSKEYAREYCRVNKKTIPDELKDNIEIQKEKEEKRVERCCPLCTESMIERTGVTSGWSMVCKQCKVQLVRLP